MACDGQIEENIDFLVQVSSSGFQARFTEN